MQSTKFLAQVQCRDQSEVICDVMESESVGSKSGEYGDKFSMGMPRQVSTAQACRENASPRLLDEPVNGLEAFKQYGNCSRDAYTGRYDR